MDWAGHADLTEGPDGKYYGVFLGIRPNEKRPGKRRTGNLYFAGRLERRVSGV